MATAHAADDSLETWIAQLGEIPDERRDPAVAPGQAEREFGVGDALARRLVAAGLPHDRGEDGPRFWRADLHYLALRLGLDCVYRGVLNRWAGSLTTLSARRETPVAVRCRAYAAAGTELELVAPGGERLRAVAGDRRMQLGFAAVMQGDQPPLGARAEAALGDILAELSRFEFCWLEAPLESDLAFVRRTRLANCLSTARLLVAEASRLGIEARLVHGLLVAPPYSTPHNWAEVRGEDGWLALDPLLLGLLARFAQLDPGAWPPVRSPGAVLLPLAEPGTPLVTTASGEPLEATFLTRAIDEA